MSEGQSTPIDTAKIADRAPSSGASSLGFWARVGLAVALLAGSGAARAWQSRRVDEVLRDGRVAPFELKNLPYRIGPWIGEDTTLDPEIAKMTGATEIVTRGYHHQITGQKITLIFLFGPSTVVYGHSPEICYPSAGFIQAVGPDRKQITGTKTGESWPFFTSIFSKDEGGRPDREEVYWTWRYSGQWKPDLATHKGFERIPGMFKVHIDRNIRSKEEIELLDVGNPCEDFLRMLMPEIDRMIASSSKTTPAKAAAPSPSRDDSVARQK